MDGGKRDCEGVDGMIGKIIQTPVTIVKWALLSCLVAPAALALGLRDMAVQCWLELREVWK